MRSESTTQPANDSSRKGWEKTFGGKRTTQQDAPAHVHGYKYNYAKSGFVCRCGHITKTLGE